MERSNAILASNLTDLEIQSHEYLELLARSQKFKMFFSGLIFSIISFIGVNPIKSDLFWLKLSEVISLFSLLLAGIFLLLRLNEITYLRQQRFCLLINVIGNIIFNSYLAYWMLFIIGISLLLINRSILLLIS